MKRLILITIFAFLGLTIKAQKSDYEKYWQAREDSINKSQISSTNKKIEFDDLYYQPSKDAKINKYRKSRKPTIDTLPDIINNNNYYNNDPYFYSHSINRFYHRGFNYWLYSNPFYFYDNYWMYDTNDWYWNMRFNNFYWSHPQRFYFGFEHNHWNSWRFTNNLYGNNHNGNSENIKKPENIQREKPSTLSNRVTPQQNRRTYTPTYNQPRMTTRPQYNNSKVSTVSTRRPAVQSRYSQPSRNYNESRSLNYNNVDHRSSGSFNSNSNNSTPRSSGNLSGSNNVGTNRRR